MDTIPSPNIVVPRALLRAFTEAAVLELAERAAMPGVALYEKYGAPARWPDGEVAKQARVDDLLAAIEELRVVAQRHGVVE